MRIRKAMAILFAVVLMAGILPTHTFAESTTDIVISGDKTGKLSNELSTIYANGCPRDQVTSITVSSGEITADDWSALFSAVINSNHFTTMNLSGTTTSAPVPDDMFSNQTLLTSVTLPSGSYSINDRAFNGCTGLTSITIPDTVTSIGYAAFSDCKSLTSISIPESATSIGSSAFSDCTGLTSITIPAKVTSAIGDNAFQGCTNLSSVSILGSVASIGNYAFKGCAKLSSITIPQSVTSIGTEAFSGCTNLNPVTFDGTPKITQLGNFSFLNDTSLTAINIPASVNSIGDNAFFGCTSLSSVTVNSNTLTTHIGARAFEGAAANAVLTVPHGLESAWDTSGDHTIMLGGTQFRIENLPPMLDYHIDRVSDTKATIGISSDEDGVYYYKIVPASKTDSTIDTSGSGKKLNGEPFDVSLSAGAYKLYIIAKDLCGNTMNDAVNIDAYCLPQDLIIEHKTTGKFDDELKSAMNLAGIPTGRFDLITNLTVSGGAFNDDDWKAMINAHAPDVNHKEVNMVNVHSIDLSKVSNASPVSDGTFNEFHSLSSIILPLGITGLGNGAFAYCPSLTSFTIPSSVTSIGISTFAGCSSLTSISIPGSVTSIGDSAFADCSSLASVTIPSSVTSIGRGTFMGCSNLASITIPGSVTSIAIGALAGCENLSSITSLRATPPDLPGDYSDFFYDLPSTGTLTVPSGSAAAYTSWVQALPGHWTITETTAPAPNGGGASSGNSAYSANVSGSGSQTTLPVTVDAGSKTASVDLGPQSFSQSGAVITVPSIPDTHTYSTKLPVSDLSTSAAKGTLTVKTGNGSITVPSNMLTSGTSGSKASISIGRADKSALPADVQTAIGDHPLIQLSMDIDGKQTEWNNPNAPVTVSIPYKPTAAELKNPEGIVIWYIDGSGKAVSVPSGHYDPSTGTVTFKTTHFSNYAVAYHPVSFTDIPAGAWYYDAVSFAAARGITTGTDESHFSPNAALTRGQFLVMLMQTYGIPSDEKPSDNFADAGSTYYTGYLAAAKRLGISTGVGNNLFAPEKGLTRQEMFTLLYNMLKTLDKLPEATSGKALSDFTDSSDVSVWAKDAMAELVKAGIVTGIGGKLSPTTATTRAQTAQILYALLTK